MQMKVWILAIALAGQAATPPPDTEIFLASLSTREGQVADLAPLGLRTVTRMAISPKVDRIALVAQTP